MACIMPKTVNSRAGFANRYQQFYAVERAPSGAFKPISNFTIHVLHHIRYDSSIAGILGAIEQWYTAFCQGERHARLGVRTQRPPQAVV